MAYTVIDSRGNVVTTIGVATTTGTTFPIELIGEGISPYGTIIATTQYYLLENFANNVQPANPVEGMFWYNSDDKLPNFYNGNQFVPIATGTNSTSVGFGMLPAATALDFGVAGTTQIFTNPGLGAQYHPTQIMLIPNNVSDVLTPANFNLQISIAEDVLETVTIINADANKHVLYNIQGSTSFAQGTDSISIEVTLAGTGGGSFSMLYDVYLFGFIKTS